MNDKELHQKSTFKKQKGYKLRDHLNDIPKKGNSFLIWAIHMLIAFEAAMDKSSRNLEMNHLIPTTNRRTGCTLPACLYPTYRCTTTWQCGVFPQSLEQGFGLGMFWYSSINT